MELKNTEYNMENNNINPQEILINSHDGIYLVDAGAGTGKTYSIVRRYRKLIKKNVKPSDILLITFTDNAAQQMREEVIKNVAGNFSITELLEAPISTFHSFCSQLLKKYGINSPSYIGLNQYILSNFRILEDENLESTLFNRFFSSFIRLNNKKYENIINSYGRNASGILKIIKKLCNVGIFPTKNDWFENGVNELKGDYSEYGKLFDELNETQIGKRGGEINNDLYNIFNGISKKLYIDFPDAKIFLNKRINPDIKDEVFYDTYQDEFIEFIRDVYFSYIEYMLKRNLLTFDFLIMFAFILLLKNKSIRKKNRFSYVMVDEFQDTDEIQFKLLMLLCKSINETANLCVVGDWKQGIYGFRNATIENILNFKENLVRYKNLLNINEKIIDYDVEKTETIILENNYRSSQEILDFSKNTLNCKATNQDEILSEYINGKFKSLKAIRNMENDTLIEFYTADDEKGEFELILKKVTELVSEKDKYKIREFSQETGELIETRYIKYSDICILSRTKDFGLELQREALKKGIPANYEGGLELFATPEAILVLAWLRLIMDESNIKGWIPVLEKEGCKYMEISVITERIYSNKNKKSLFSDVPELCDFLEKLVSIKDNIIHIIESIFGYYKINNEISNKIISLVGDLLKVSSVSVRELVWFIVQWKNVEFDIDLHKTTDALVIKTIHKAKGLEFPVVFVSNCNVKKFPSTRGESGNVVFNRVCGLRPRKIYGSHNNYFYNFDDWKSECIWAMVKGKDYDEERRLLYVASTRPKQYLFYTASNPSTFFTGLASASGKNAIRDFEYEIKLIKTEVEKVEPFSITSRKLTDKKKEIKSPHYYMNISEKYDFDKFKEDEKKFVVEQKENALKYGTIIHNIACRIAKRIEVKENYEEIAKIKNFIENLKTERLYSEQDFLLPVDSEIIRGTIDLIAVKENEIIIVDYKTDKSKDFLESYKIQLSFYRKFILDYCSYSDSPFGIRDRNKITIKCIIYFISLDDIVELDNAELNDNFKKIYNKN